VLWDRRSIRAQLIIVFAVIELAAALVAGGVTVFKARTSTRVEIAASMELAGLLVSEAVRLMQQEVPAEQFLADLSSRLRLARHVRFAVRDAAGNPLTGSAGKAEVTRTDERPPAPAWFAALIAPPGESRTVPVLVNGVATGSVEIASEPKDEIAEVWENTVALAVVALAVNLVVGGLLYLLFGRVLDPLGALARGLGDLERRDYAVRLQRPRPHELAAIADRFNALAAALETTRAENLSLNRRVITAQDDERRRTALELHDEVGPCLFGLKANATSIANAIGALDGRAVQDRVRDILAIVEHLQSLNRSLLNRLRPMALGHVPLRDILSELVNGCARQHPDIAFTFSGKALARGYGDSIDLTIYRCVQEGLTNVLRHAQASHVGIEIAERYDAGLEGAGQSAPLIRLTMRDDGQGIDPAAPKGFGLAGMRERVEVLGGRYTIESRAGLGTCIHILIPLRGAHGDAENRTVVGIPA
jgi:two-component system sensor histidine kinase UhpB